jgi:hypothetical protein
MTDCYVAGPDDLTEGVMKRLRKAYTITEAPGDWFLKIQFRESEDGRRMSMSQPMYATDIVKAMGLDTEISNSSRIPMDTPLSRGDHIPLTEDEEDFMADKHEQFGHVVGMLGALMLSTRPDLAYCVG